MAETSAANEPRRRPVLLHTGWRSGGTWLWARFRALPWVEAYYEPLHETLATLTPQSVRQDSAQSWASGHPTMMQPYYHEYGPLLRGAGGVEGFHTSFSTGDFFADAEAELPEVRAYLARLFAHAEGRGRQPVLKFCRSIGRVGWMRRHFPEAVHLVMLRNPALQFESARQLLLQHGNPYFLVMPFVVLARNRDHLPVAAVLRLFDVDLPPVTAALTTDDSLRVCAAWAKTATIARWYRAFMAFWVLGVLGLPDDVDRCIDASLLTLVPRYRARARADLVRLTGLPVRFDAPPPRLRVCSGIGVPVEDVWQCHQMAAALLAERLGADWARTATGRMVAGMLAHADLLAASDDESEAREVDPVSYLTSLRVRAMRVSGRLEAASRPVMPLQWVNDRLAELGSAEG